jgi:hypothetical protein
VSKTLDELGKPNDWLGYWKNRDAWTLREFAQLCCGWNPSLYEFPNREAYSEALESINRGVRVGAIPTIENLKWPPTGAERMYDAVPAFRPKDVTAWASKHYPERFPYSTQDWESEDLDPRERTTLLAIIYVLAEMAKVPWSEPSKAAGIIAAVAARQRVRIGVKTIETHLNRIEDAIDRRSRDQ